jgi:S1-C subfamily serine protease
MNKYKQKKVSWSKIFGICITLSIIGGLIGGALTNEYLIAYFFDKFIQKQEKNSPILKKVIEERTFVEDSLITTAVEKTSPAIVAIFSSELDAENALKANDNKQFIEITSDKFYLGKPYKNSSSLIEIVSGAPGFFISNDGLIATCASNVDGQNKWYIVLKNNEIYPAILVYKDKYNNFAFLKIDSSENKPFRYSKTLDFIESPIKLGQKIIAFGIDPQMNIHLKSGIISFYDNLKKEKQNLSFPYDFINIDFEIDSSLNCGPVVNLGGELIGMSLDFDTVEQGTSFVIPTEVLQQAFHAYITENSFRE